jgi:hypothetical protein
MSKMMASAPIVPFSGTLRAKKADFAPIVPVFGTLGALKE